MLQYVIVKRKASVSYICIRNKTVEIIKYSMLIQPTIVKT